MQTNGNCVLLGPTVYCDSGMNRIVFHQFTAPDSTIDRMLNTIKNEPADVLGVSSCQSKTANKGIANPKCQLNNSSRCLTYPHCQLSVDTIH